MKGDNGSKSTCKEKLNYTTTKKYRERWGKMMIDMQQLNLLESTGNCGFQLYLSVKDEKKFLNLSAKDAEKIMKDVQ